MMKAELVRLMNVELVTGCDAQIASWVAERIPDLHGRPFPPRTTAIGIGLGGAIIAGFVYFNWVPEAGHIEMGLAADSPRWATRRTIHELLRYAFHVCDCQRITLITSAQNLKAQRVAEATGFVREATIARLYGADRDGVLYRQFREDWWRGRFGAGVVNGQGQRAEST